MGDNILDVISENSPLVERQIEKAASLLEYMPGAALNPIIGTGPTPIYTPREIEKLALCDDPQYNKYGVEPTNQELAVRFKDSFATLYSGIMPDIIDELRDDWVDAVYKEQEQLGGEDDKIHRQNIIALGWHPDFNILEADWATLNKHTLKKIMEEYQYDGSSIIDICEFVKLANDKSSKKTKENPKNPNEKNLNPIFITLVGGRSDSIPSSLIKWWTKGPFCHAAIGFRHTLDDMKSFNTSKFNGLSDEDLKFYSPEEKLAVYTIFVEDDDMKSIKKEIDYYVDNRDKTRYSRLNIASIVFNVPLNFQFDMVCSQFVDRVLKFAKIDLTGKDSSLVSPNDFWKASKNNKKMYKVYDGKVGDYKPNKVKAALDRLLHSKKTKTIKECVESILNEKYLFSTDNLEFNLDNWRPEPGKNLLHISGISGAGKSTLMRKLRSEYDCEVIESDAFTYKQIKGPDAAKSGLGVHKFIDEYFESHEVTPSKNWETLESKEEFNKFYDWLEERISQPDAENTLYIIEGFQIYAFLDPARLVDKPVIIMGTSMITSYVRRTRRDFNKPKTTDDWIIHNIKIFLRMFNPSFFKRYVDGERDLMKFINALEINSSPIDESIYEDYIDYIPNEVKVALDGLPHSKKTKTIKECAELVLEKKSQYDPPYTREQIRDNYGEETLERLMKDPAHAWRADNGIELIHNEPSEEELDRIWDNWNKMNSVQKSKSDAKCKELSGMNNAKLYKFLKDNWANASENTNIYSYTEPEIIEENLIMKQNDIFLNFEKWKKGKNNVLYITGLSGSGKTTLGKEYALKYKAKLVSMDDCEDCTGIWAEVRKQAPKYNKFISSDEAFDGNNEEHCNAIGEAHKTLYRMLAEDKDTLYIVEGIQIWDTYAVISDSEEDMARYIDRFKGKPMIIKGTSMLTSSIRRIQRANKNHGFFDSCWVAIRSAIMDTPSMIKSERSLGRFKKDIIKANGESAYEDCIDYVPLYPVLETKEFPVQFDEDGNLIIKNYKKLDYNKEYQLSHQSLKAYAKAKQYEGIKYELSKLWFINTLIMVKIHDNKIEEDEKAELTKIRAWIMNDYTTYLKMITDEDPSFNFSKYYEDSPFSDVRIKINSHTIRGVADLIKYAVK